MAEEDGDKDGYQNGQTAADPFTFKSYVNSSDSGVNAPRRVEVDGATTTLYTDPLAIQGPTPMEQFMNDLLSQLKQRSRGTEK